jgi:hypothetical protein
MARQDDGSLDAITFVSSLMMSDLYHGLYPVRRYPGWLNVFSYARVGTLNQTIILIDQFDFIALVKGSVIPDMIINNEMTSHKAKFF